MKKELEYAVLQRERAATEAIAGRENDKGVYQASQRFYDRNLIREDIEKTILEYLDMLPGQFDRITEKQKQLLHPNVDYDGDHIVN